MKLWQASLRSMRNHMSIRSLKQPSNISLFLTDLKPVAPIGLPIITVHLENKRNLFNFIVEYDLPYLNHFCFMSNGK